MIHVRGSELAFSARRRQHARDFFPRSLNVRSTRARYLLPTQIPGFPKISPSDLLDHLLEQIYKAVAVLDDGERDHAARPV